MLWPIIFCLIIDMLGFKSNIMIFFYHSLPSYDIVPFQYAFISLLLAFVLYYHTIYVFKPIIHCYHFCFKQLIIFKRNLDTRKDLYVYPHSYHFWCSSFFVLSQISMWYHSVSTWRTSFTFLPVKNWLYLSYIWKGLHFAFLLE